jgi:hypothetical protein
MATNTLWAEKEEITSTGPRVTFEETTHDLGTVDPQSLKAAFKFKNTGDKTLEISNIRPACHCTVAEVSIAGQKVEKGKDGKYRVEPGQEGAITAQVDAANLQGRIEKEINVASNDTKTPNVRLRIVAVVKADVMVLPLPVVFFTALQPDTVTNQTLEIRSTLADPLVVEKVETSASWLTASVGETSTNSAKIQVSTKPPIPGGMQNATVTAHTKYEKYKNVLIRVSAQVPQTITVFPSRLVFMKKQNSATSDVSVLVSRNDGKDFHIWEVQSDSPQITTVLTTKQPGHSYQINITYTPKDGQQPASGKLVIQTDEPKGSKLEIPYSFR